MLAVDDAVCSTFSSAHAYIEHATESWKNVLEKSVEFSSKQDSGNPGIYNLFTALNVLCVCVCSYTVSMMLA